MAVISSLRHRVVAAGREGVAAPDAHGTHPAALQPAVPLNRLVRVVRAGGVVPAGRREDLRKRQLVTTDQQQKKLRHGVNLASLSAASEASALSSANGISRTRRRAIRTTSYRIPTRHSGESAPISCSLATSRRRRRARLRSTDPLMARLTVTPIRCSGALLGTANPTSACPE